MERANDAWYRAGMMRRLQGWGFAWAFAGMALTAACGSTTQLPQAPQKPPLTAASVSVKQTGTAPVTIIPGSIAYKLDDSGSLVILLQVTSRAKTAETIMLRASLFGPNGALVGDASGGEQGVAPGATVGIQLNGPKPNDEIISATFEATSLPLP